MTGVLREFGLPAGASEGLDDSYDKADRVGVGLVLVDPGREPWPTVGHPVGQERGLACPRRTDHQAEPSLLPSVQLVQQPRAVHQVRAALGTQNFDVGKRRLRGPSATPLLSVNFSCPPAAPAARRSPTKPDGAEARLRSLPADGKSIRTGDKRGPDRDHGARSPSPPHSQRPHGVPRSSPSDCACCLAYPARAARSLFAKTILYLIGYLTGWREAGGG